MTKTRPLSEPRRDTLLRAEVLGIDSEDFVLVRLHRAPTEGVLRAELALPGYSPVPGDRVLVDEGPEGWFVLGALGPARRRVAVPLAAGLIARSNGEAGVELHVAEGDLTLSATGRVVVRAGTEVTTTAASVSTTASQLTESVGRRELTAERVVERAADVYRRATGLVETTAGRARTLVEGDLDLCAGRTSIASEEDTVIDGKRVLLG
ncbi:MAG: DUF3540 domain-containing protein [Polyangiaceae bacterium]